MYSAAGNRDDRWMVSKFRPNEKHNTRRLGNLILPKVPCVQSSFIPDQKLPSFSEQFVPILEALVGYSSPTSPTKDCECFDYLKHDEEPHVLFNYCTHTSRLGRTTQASAILSLIRRWRKDNAHLSLAELLVLRNQRDSTRELYMSTEKSRPSKSEAAHPKSERNRRAMHKDSFAELDLRIPDFIMELARTHKEDLTLRYQDSKKPSSSNLRSSKNAKTGKEELHLAVLMLLDFDVMIMDELMRERQQHERKCLELERKQQELGQKLQQYEAAQGPLDCTPSTALSKRVRESMGLCPTSRVCTTECENGLQIFTSAHVSTANLNGPKRACRTESNVEIECDHYTSSNASPSKRRRLSEMLPSPTPSYVDSWADVVRS